MENKFLDIVHKELFELLKYVNYVCDREKITYSLAYGSMLGAIRHKGFIPWDDDLDIFMTRDNYENFEKIFINYETDKIGFKQITACGGGRIPKVFYKNNFENDEVIIKNLVCDIFIIDNLPNKKNKRKRLFFKLKKVQGMMKKEKIDYRKYDLKGKILVAATKILGLFRTKKSLVREYVKLSAKYRHETSQEVFCSNDEYAYLEKAYKKSLFNNVIKIDFCGENMNVYEGFDEILTTQFDDYMTPLKMEGREHISIEEKQIACSALYLK